MIQTIATVLGIVNGVMTAADAILGGEEGGGFAVDARGRQMQRAGFTTDKQLLNLQLEAMGLANRKLDTQDRLADNELERLRIERRRLTAEQADIKEDAKEALGFNQKRRREASIRFGVQTGLVNRQAGIDTGALEALMAERGGTLSGSGGAVIRSTAFTRAAAIGEIRADFQSRMTDLQENRASIIDTKQDSLRENRAELDTVATRIKDARVSTDLIDLARAELDNQERAIKVRIRGVERQQEIDKKFQKGGNKKSSPAPTSPTSIRPGASFDEDFLGGNQ